MPQQNYTIRQATLRELEIMVNWAAQEGWNPGLSDAESFYRADPSGFLIGYLDKEPIACISAVSYENEYAFIGFYIVKENYRGYGYGIQIWNRAMEHLSQHKNIGLDGVVAQQENYKKSGFVLAYGNIRFEATVSHQNDISNNYHVIPIQTNLWEAISKYDKEIFGHERVSFLKSWLNQPHGLALCIMEHQQVKGYGVIRKCRVGYKIGPLFCDDEKIADALYQALIKYAKIGEKVFLDVPEVNDMAVQLAQKYNMQKSFETARMYTNLTVEYPVNKVFGVSTFELG